MNPFVESRLRPRLCTRPRPHHEFDFASDPVRLSDTEETPKGRCQIRQCLAARCATEYRARSQGSPSTPTTLPTPRTAEAPVTAVGAGPVTTLREGPARPVAR